MRRKRPQKLNVDKAKRSIQRRRPGGMIRKGLTEVLPTSIQKSYNMLSDTERDVLDAALRKYRPGQSDPIFVGGVKVLRPDLRLLTRYRLVIEEIKYAAVMTNYTRWLDAVQVSGTENQEVHVSF